MDEVNILTEDLLKVSYMKKHNVVGFYSGIDTTVTHMLTLIPTPIPRKAHRASGWCCWAEFVDSALVLLVCIANMPLDKCVSLGNNSFFK